MVVAGLNRWSLRLKPSRDTNWQCCGMPNLGVPSVSVRWSPLLVVAIVLTLVTPLRAGFGLTTWMQTTGTSDDWPTSALPVRTVSSSAGRSRRPLHVCRHHACAAKFSRLLSGLYRRVANSLDRRRTGLCRHPDATSTLGGYIGGTFRPHTHHPAGRPAVRALCGVNRQRLRRWPGWVPSSPFR